MIGKRLRELRRAAGLHQAEVADRAGLSRSSIANIEAERQDIPVATLLLLAGALGTSASVLLGEQPARTAPSVRIETRCVVICADCGAVATTDSHDAARAARTRHVEREHLFVDRSTLDPEEKP